MSTFRRRLVIMSSDSKYAIVKCYNDTFDLACLTDGIVEYLDTYGDTQYIAGSATGTINVYHDSEVRITKASGIALCNGQECQKIESNGIDIKLTEAHASATNQLELQLINCNLTNIYRTVYSSLTLDNISNTTIGKAYQYITDTLKIANSPNLTNVYYYNYSQSPVSGNAYRLQHISLDNCPLLEKFTIRGHGTTNRQNRLQTFTIQNCPALNGIALNGMQYINIDSNSNKDNSANFYAFLRNIPTRTNADGEIYIAQLGAINGVDNTADNIMIDGVTMRTYLENKGWTFLDNKPAWAESTTI